MQSERERLHQLIHCRLTAFAATQAVLVVVVATAASANEKFFLLVSSVSGSHTHTQRDTLTCTVDWLEEAPRYLEAVSSLSPSHSFSDG